MSKNTSFVVKGNIYYSQDSTTIVSYENSYVVCVDGVSQGVFSEIPSEYATLPLHDYSDSVILPGMSDLHLHAPQYGFRGLNMHLQLIDWLNQVAFPEESKYTDLSYAKKAYQIFALDLVKSYTTRACIFGTIHKEATIALMDILEATNLKTMVGKVNMDRNSPDYLREKTNESIEETLDFIQKTKGHYKNVEPIITPRFLPTCTDVLSEELGKMAKEYQLPIQSHLSENLGEIEWVKELYPQAASYGDAYDQFQLLGNNTSTIMAHCVYLTQDEIQLLKERKVYLTHCPTSNTNIMSGIAPMRKYFDEDLLMGLGSDVAGGDTLSMLKVMVEAIKVSKLRSCLVDQTTPLTVEEVFYLATKGGGSFFGKVGSFQEGFEFDALIIDDTSKQHPQSITPLERLERIIYESDSHDLIHKYCGGQRIF